MAKKLCVYTDVRYLFMPQLIFTHINGPIVSLFARGFRLFLNAAECTFMFLHNTVYLYWSCVHRSSNQDLASIQPPLDSHGQNLLLHALELKHHIRKMMLMKMAAQHQQAGGNVSNLIKYNTG